MYNHEVFAVLTAKDRKNRARTAFALPENSKWFQGAIGGIAEAPTIDSRETTPAHLDDEDSDSVSECLVLSFKQLLETDLTDGIRFGTDPKLCHVLLGHRGTKNVSRTQYTITVGENLSIWLYDGRSTHGTAVEYNGQCRDQVRKNETWILSYEPRNKIRFEKIQIYAGNLSFQIEFPNHDTGDAGYVQNLHRFVKKSQGLPTLRNLDLQSAPTTGAPSRGKTPGTEVIYYKDQVIGTGAFGEVSRVIRVRDGRFFASKTVFVPAEKRKRGQPVPSRQHDVEAIRREFGIMKRIKHPNVVDVIELRENPVPELILEYFPLGHWTSAHFLEHECVTAFGQLLDGLKYLHTNGIVHRDLKPENVLVTANPHLRFAISDFGLSKLVSDTALLTTFCGTLKYTAPEVFPGRVKNYEASVDIWSLGVLVLEAVYGKLEPPDIPKSSQYWKTWIESWFRMLQNKLNDQEDDILVAILHEMVTFDPGSRPDADSCLQRGFENGLFEMRADDRLVICRNSLGLEHTPPEIMTTKAPLSSEVDTSQLSEASTVVISNLHSEELHLLVNNDTTQSDGLHRNLRSRPANEEEFPHREQDDQQISTIDGVLWGQDMPIQSDDGANYPQQSYQCQSDESHQSVDDTTGNTAENLQRSLAIDARILQRDVPLREGTTSDALHLSTRELFSQPVRTLIGPPPRHHDDQLDRSVYEELHCGDDATIAYIPAEKKINATHILGGFQQQKYYLLRKFLQEHPSISKDVRHGIKHQGTYIFKHQGTYISYEDAWVLLLHFRLDLQPVRTLIGPPPSHHDDQLDRSVYEELHCGDDATIAYIPAEKKINATHILGGFQQQKYSLLRKFLQEHPSISKDVRHGINQGTYISYEDAWVLLLHFRLDLQPVRTLIGPPPRHHDDQLDRSVYEELHCGDDATIAYIPAEKKINATHMLRGFQQRKYYLLRKFLFKEHPSVSIDVRHGIKHQGTYISYDDALVLYTHFELNMPLVLHLINQAAEFTDRDNPEDLIINPAISHRGNYSGVAMGSGAGGSYSPSGSEPDEVGSPATVTSQCEDYSDMVMDSRAGDPDSSCNSESEETGSLATVTSYHDMAINSRNSDSPSGLKPEETGSPNCYKYFVNPSFKNGSYLAPAHDSHLEMRNSVVRARNTGPDSTFDSCPYGRPEIEDEWVSL